ncbi:MAG: tRNA (adenosine(37)-N6)-dimethylallyltransferase MiaA [Ignavibacteriae bacterium]|nr:tRNA (adenosine(37)-N6)-dimethylallyltransferase MiaA [Ignavibacteriota bacterium]
MELKVLVIVGPTCSGKTDLGIDLAQKLKSEIISADSRQIFKLLNIGTAKPTETELNLIKHHLINKLNPDEIYNVSKFEKDSFEVINNLHKQNKIPIVVGGSGLYIKAIIDGIFDEVDIDENYRLELLEKRKIFGNEYLYNLLQKIDPKTSSTLLPQNWKRIIRALEVFHLTGKPIWEFHENQNRVKNINFLQFGLDWEREILYKNIEARVDSMIENGLVNEVKSILNLGFGKSLNSLNTVGYKEIIDYLENKQSLERAIELIKRNTRRYAKRQLTWFRKDERINWVKINSENEIEDLSEKIIKSLN